jgi:hypothetical protein
MKPKTLVKVFGAYPGIVLASETKPKPPEGHIRVEYQTPTGRVRAYVPIREVKERK